MISWIHSLLCLRCHCPLSHQSQPYHLIAAPAEPPDIHLHTQDSLWEMHIPPSDSPAGKFSAFLHSKGTGKIMNTNLKARSIYIYCLTLTFLLPVLWTMLPRASKVVHLLFSLPRVQFPHPFPPRDSYSVFRSLNNLGFPPTTRKKKSLLYAAIVLPPCLPSGKLHFCHFPFICELILLMSCFLFDCRL